MARPATGVQVFGKGRVSKDSTMPTSRTSFWVAGAVLAAAPILSFGLQYFLDIRSDTLLFENLTVTYMDWVFVPFNLLVVHVINWRRGAAIFAIAALSIVVMPASHAFWQYFLLEPGYMFTSERAFQPAGWVHLCYSTLQMMLLMAFVVARRSRPRFVRVTTFLAVVYFVGAGICGYLIHRGFMVTDVAMVICGLAMVLAVPRWLRTPPRNPL